MVQGVKSLTPSGGFAHAQRWLRSLECIDREGNVIFVVV